MADCIAPVYLPASWKGVPFFCDSTSDEFGRRGDLYEYPLSDQPGYKDLGRKARRFKVEGYLIGTDQVGQTVAMKAAAESPEPGMLMHPIHGGQMVACVSLTAAADYRKDKKRTKLSFEFVEANQPASPLSVGAAISTLFNLGSSVIALAAVGVSWLPGIADIRFATNISAALAQQIIPATDEDSFDAIDLLRRGSFPDFASVINPINFASATVARIHPDDALTRLRDFNVAIVQQTALVDYTPAVSAVSQTARLIAIRDFAAAAARKRYETVKGALDDLDFVMAVYDEEESIALHDCNDALVTAIRSARAAAVSAILSRNIRLPGISSFPVDGVWPSVVVAHKLYADATRFQQVERYNPAMSPFWMGRDVVGPAA